MHALRRLFRLRARAVWALVALTLAMKVIVPVGFMPSFAGGEISIVVCTGMGPIESTMSMPMGGMDHGKSEHAPPKPESPCLGAGLAAPVLGGAGPLLLALAFAVAVVAGLLLTIAPPRPSPAHLRPPLRGPPLAA